MEADTGLVAGSHSRGELTIARSTSTERPMVQYRSDTCQICGEDVGTSMDGGPFMACQECRYPICKPCSVYERKHGSHACPKCKARYLSPAGSPGAKIDKNEDHENDIEKELNGLVQSNDQQRITEAMLQGHLSFGRGNNSESSMHGEQEHSSRSSPAAPSHHALCTPLIGRGKKIHPLPFNSEPSTPGHSYGSTEISGDLSSFGYGSVAWKDRVRGWKIKQQRSQMMVTQDAGDASCRQSIEEDGFDGQDLPMDDLARQPLSRKVNIASSKINPYRMIIIVRLVVIGFFFRYRILNPVPNAYPLWLTSIICEIWFALSWILDQFPKWLPISRETYLDRLSLRYEREGEPSQLAAMDIFVSTVDPMKEPPLVTANTILSILAVDYPVEKFSCYVSDDGASMLTFGALSETSEFARKWVPFCKKFNIEPRAPEVYFTQKIDYLKDKVQPSFVKDRRVMKREYEEFKVRVNALVAKAQKVPEEGWTMQDGTPWPGNNTKDHPGMIQVFLGHNGGFDVEGNELPRLVYVSREKRPGFQHHKKAGAMNALVRVSAVLTNAPFFLNLDCDHYVNNSKALREAMCFMMDPTIGKKVCYVQFPQRFDGIDPNDRYANHNTVFFDINMKGLDGVQGPVYVGTGCCFRRQALYGYEAPSKVRKRGMSCDCFSFLFSGLKGQTPRVKKEKTDKKQLPPRSKKDPIAPTLNLEDIEAGLEGLDDDSALLVCQKNFENRFGQSTVFVASTLLEDGGVPQSVAGPAALLKEAIHVISCGYEDKTDWGKEIGWIYGSVTEDILTGFKMHNRGWRSIYCMPHRPAFKGSAPINLTDRLNQVLRWALGSVEIFLSRHCPLWYGYGNRLKWLERFAYVNTIVYPFTSIPLLVYCTLPAVCLLTGKFMIPTISNFASLWFISLFLSIFATGILEMRWSGVGIDEWWRNEQFWVIGGVSAHLFAVFQGLLKVLAGIDTNFTVTAKASEDVEFGELYTFKWSALLIPPTTLLIINIVGVVAGVSNAISNGFQTWGPLFGKLFFAFWVIVHLYPFLKGLMGRQNRTPTIVVVWSVLLASIFSLLWVRIDPFLIRVKGPDLAKCGINC